MTIAAFAGAGNLGWFINLGLNSLNVEMICWAPSRFPCWRCSLISSSPSWSRRSPVRACFPTGRSESAQEGHPPPAGLIAVGVCVALVVVAIGETWSTRVEPTPDRQRLHFTRGLHRCSIYKRSSSGGQDRHQVDTTFGLANTSLEMTAMENGDIGMVMDYSGQVYLSVLGLPLNATPTESEILSEKMRDGFWPSRLPRPLGYNNTYAAGVRRGSPSGISSKPSPESVAVAPELRLGCTADFTRREDALPRLESTFHTKFGGSTLWTWRCAIPPSTAAGGCYRRLRHPTPSSRFDLVRLEDDASFFRLLRGQLYPSGVSGQSTPG